MCAAYSHELPRYGIKVLFIIIILVCYLVSSSTYVEFLTFSLLSRFNSTYAISTMGKRIFEVIMLRY